MRIQQEYYKIPFKQNMETAPVASVSIGTVVLRGECMTKLPKGMLGANLHAPVSGTITEINSEQITIKALEEQSQLFVPIKAEGMQNLMEQAGLVGMGGAGFPTHIKLNTILKEEGTVIINAAECEPILVHNAERIQTDADQIIAGLQAAMQMVQAEKGVIAIKEKHKQAIEALKYAIKKDTITIHLLPDSYPMGEERAVIREVTSTLLKPSQLPADANVMVLNAETVYRIAEAVTLKKPVMTKDITVAGRIKGESNIQVIKDVPIGTTVGTVLKMAGGCMEDYGEIIMGGPFTGRRTSLEEPITKTTGGILVTMPFLQEKRNLGLLVCACGASENRMREIAESMGASISGVVYCKQAVKRKGIYKCDNPGKCPGQSQKVTELKKEGAEALLIGNCTDCSNTVMSISPKLQMPVHHITDGALRAVSHKLIRKVSFNKLEKGVQIMSMTKEAIQEHLSDPAIFCCQRKKGLIISEADLEDPNIFPDLEESGLITRSENGLTIQEVLGKTLLVDAEALTSITKDMIDGAKRQSVKEKKALPIKEVNVEEHMVKDMEKTTIEVSVDKLEGLKLSVPLALINGFPAFKEETKKAAVPNVITRKEPVCEEKVIRSLVQKEYPVKKAELGEETSYNNGVLTIDQKLMEKAKASDPLVKDIEMDIIAPNAKHVYTNTIMDIIPIASKVEGKLGEGETAVLSGAVFCLTGLDEAGVQIHEFGSCEGYIDEKIAFGRPGCPDKEDILIRVNVVIQEGTGMERRGAFAAHSACDVIIQEIRDVMKKITAEPEKETIYKDVHKLGRPRVVLVKEIMGQGAMHDNVLVPAEPAGVLGGQKNVDLGNVPVMLSPNEVHDGGIHALTCIGPSTKEMTRHYFREPLVNELSHDEELDFVGVIFIGSPQVNDEKTYVSKRLGALVETMALDGAIVTTEGFGNNHIDFASNIEAIGSREIPIVGVTFSAYQGQLVVGNKYMDAMIELNKDKDGFENEVLGCSSITSDDAKRAVAMLKNKMAGVPIAAPNRKWSQEVIDANQKLVK